MSRMAIQAAVTMGQLQHKLDQIGHNMANVNTTGYKSRQADFSSLLFQQIDNLKRPDETNRLTPDGIRIGNGAKLANTNINLQQGAVLDTGRPLDVALLKNNQMFQVNVTANGVTETQYTRSGAFYLNPLGDGTVILTNGEGHPVIGENGTIQFADGFDEINITSSGQIETKRNGTTQIVGQLAVVEAVRPHFLEAAGENNFRFKNSEDNAYNINDIIQPVNQLEVKNNALEGSNVDIAKQMTELTLTQRAYQFNARSISMNDQMMGLINQLR